ncbi:MAG: hypothetical protein QW760_03860 [Thermofilaceae archaeon]
MPLTGSMLMLTATAAAIVVVAVVLAIVILKSRKKKDKGRYKWAALVDKRGLVVEAQGQVDKMLAVYAVQAVKVFEEAGGLSELRVRIGENELQVTPQEDGVYRVVLR